jgi:hypothetical protein
MLAKFWVGALGMWLYLRSLGARPVAAVLAGIIYAGSSFMVDWLFSPAAAVAALIPFGFAAVEWYLRDARRAALVALAVVTAMQFFGGHAETSLQMGGALALYAGIRVLSLQQQRVARLAGLASAAIAGFLVAGIQLIPFAAYLGGTSVSADRTAASFGLLYLPIGDLSSWLVPNAVGNPAIDGVFGRAPNYTESTGFATVAALVLAPLGLWQAWVRRSAAVLALAVLGVVSAAIVYGPLTPLSGRLPGLSVSYNARFIGVLCLVVAALAGLGFNAMLDWQPAGHGWRPRVLYACGIIGLAGSVFCALALMQLGSGVDRLLPAGPGGSIGFWLVVAGFALGSALAFVASWLAGGDRRMTAGAIAALVLVEVAIFAGPYNPRVPVNEVPPHSAALDWLRENGGGKVAATYLILVPETANLYGITDARGYDVLIDRRQRTFWSAADPGFQDPAHITILVRPDPRFLAAAGVTDIVTPANALIPGTDPEFSGEGVVIARVPGARPFAFVAPGTITVADTSQAAIRLAANPLGPVVVENCCALTDVPSPGPTQASVGIMTRQPEAVDLDVVSSGPATVVILQSYDSGWVARVDGHPTRIDPADILFQAVQVPAGEHIVSLRYEPASVAIGGLMTALGLLGLALIAAAGKRPRWLRRSAARFRGTERETPLRSRG